MQFEYAKRYVREQLENYLEGKGIDTCRPFRCLNPDHADTNPSMSYDRKRNKCHCFSCNADYDTFDLIGIDYNTSGGETFKRAFELYGLQVESDRPTAASDFKGVGISKPANTTQPANNNPIPTQQQTQPQQPKPEPDPRELTAAIDQAHAALMNNPAALKYLTDRGLTLDTIRRHKIGYSEGGQNPLLQGYNSQFQSQSRKAPLYKLTFPILNNNGQCVYFISEISDRSQIDQYNGKYKKLKNTPQKFFNESCIAYNKGFIFVCEGVYDALSIEQLGGRAIALTGTAGNSRILEIESKPNTDNAYIIALDNDGAGQKAADSLKQAFNKAGRTCIIAPLEGAKDANELLQHNPAALSAYIREATQRAAERKAKDDITRGIVERELLERDQDTAKAGEIAAKVVDREEEAAAYPKLTAAAQLQDFINNIQKSEFTPYFSTGFRGLNNVLDGGIYPGGLYFIGAISSLGKTTLALQIADNIAASGQDVLIFSLEMARDELISKSISRHTLIEDMKQNNSTANAKSTRGIMTGSRYKNYNTTERNIIQSAIDSYAKYADHIYISVGVGTIGVKEIKAAVEKHIRITGKRPVIVIDYLQILAPADPRATDKQNTDNNVLELKRLARDHSIPVIGISSFNRDNYTAPVNMASFKESGAVEYSADVLIGLQHLGMDYLEGESKDSREKRIRDLMNAAITNGKEGRAQHIQVKVLKNRNGSKGEALLDFYPMFNYFCDSTQTQTEQEREKRTPGKPARQKALDELLAAFREAASPAGSNTASLETLAEKLDLKKATLKGKLKEFTKLFTIQGDTVTYTPDPAADQSDTDPHF